MATEANNILTNSFLKGMNTDASMDIVDSSSYVFGQNIRITTNTLLLSISDSNSTEGIVAPVPIGEEIETEDIYNGDYRILATASIEDIGAVIISKKNKWYIYRVDLAENPIRFTLQFESEELDSEKINKTFSVVINREMKDVVKLYIADGVHLIMLINLLDDKYNSTISGNTDNITSNRIYPALQAGIVKQISGQLKTSLVQYTYRLYKKYGISSRLAPLTNKIHIIDNNRNKEEGNAEDTYTSLGLLIMIPIADLDVDKSIFDHVLIFRLSYIKAQEDANVDLIYDSSIKDENLIINDNGYTSLKELSIDEFQAINSMIIVPQSIESNLNYLFMSNIEDLTIMRIDNDNIAIDSKTYSADRYGNYKVRNNMEPFTGDIISKTDINEIPDDYDVNIDSIINTQDQNKPAKYTECKYNVYDGVQYYGGTGRNINWRFVTTDVVVHDLFDYNSTTAPYSTGKQKANVPIKYLIQGPTKTHSYDSDITVDDYLKQHSISAMKSLEYDDIIGSSMLRSLRRDEIYRYGIVYYDKYGKRSDVQWIGDIKTPRHIEAPEFSFGRDNVLYIELTGISLLEATGEPLIYNAIVRNEDYKSIYINGNVTIQASIVKVVVEHADVFNPVYANWDSAKPLSEYLTDENPALFGLTFGLGSDNAWFDQSYDITEQKRVSFRLTPVYDFKVKLFSDRGLYRTKATVKLTITPHTDENMMMLKSHPIGVQFNISVPKSSGIKHYQIVRCSKASEYSRTLMLCAISRPMRQRYSANATNTGMNSPFYPSPFLTSQFISTFDYLNGRASSANNVHLFQAHSSEIAIFPEDSLSLIHKNDSDIKPVRFNHYGNDVFDDSGRLNAGRASVTEGWPFEEPSPKDNIIKYNRHVFAGAAEDATDFKTEVSSNLYLYRTKYEEDLLTSDSKGTLNPVVFKTAVIEEVSQVQVPTWEQGYSNIQLSGALIISGVKAYKSYVSTVKTDEYVNWVCNGMYNLRISNSEALAGLDDSNNNDNVTKMFTYHHSDDWWRGEQRSDRAKGWTGPGPQCILIRVTDNNSSILHKNMIVDGEVPLGTVICNIEHVAQQFAGFNKQEKSLDIYYGFGNHGTLTEEGDNMVGSIVVFDGDVYNLPCELMSMYKTYNFNSIHDTLPSAQVVNYVPLETKINTFFDYGMNYRNTSSPNVQVEPGEITGVCSQDRPQHLYNPIYSDNNLSNDVYNAQSEEWSDQSFPQRIFYSQIKTNGELIDNWSDFRALDYIDADTRYGLITHMLTNKDTLYFWLSNAFGKLSVNERSLITDTNNNTIQLGQGGVLQRTDYIDTRHGIREHDRSAINAGNGIFWIDVWNKAILSSQGNSVVNYGEAVNVQNVINEKISEDIPKIDYDTQNEELICKCLKDDQQIIFSTKLNCATSIYTREYSDILYYNNVLYGLTNDSKIVKYNYLDTDDNTAYLSPTIISFVVNQVPSATKVFDNQQLITMKRNYKENFAEKFMLNKLIEFETNIDSSRYDHDSKEVVTDREANLTYCIPRIDNQYYGNRLRGRWMKVTITDEDPKYDYSISHVLTKFRQSFN